MNKTVKWEFDELGALIEHFEEEVKEMGGAEAVNYYHEFERSLFGQFGLIMGTIKIEIVRERILNDAGQWVER